VFGGILLGAVTRHVEGVISINELLVIRCRCFAMADSC
jgi:hypothetical protein